MESHRRPSTYSGCKGGPSQLCPQVVSQGTCAAACLPPTLSACMHATPAGKAQTRPFEGYVRPAAPSSPTCPHALAPSPSCLPASLPRRPLRAPSLDRPINSNPTIDLNGLPLSLSLFAILRGPSLPSSFVQAGPLLPGSLSLFNPSPYEDRPELRTRNSSRSSFPACPPLNPPRLH